MEKARTQSQHFWSNFNSSFPPEDGQNKKNEQQWGKTSATELSKYVKMKSLSPLPYQRKILLLSAIFQRHFTRKKGWVTSQRGRINISKIIFHPHDSRSTSCKKNLVQIFSSFAAIDHNKHFRKILTQILNLAGFLGTIPAFFKNLS